MSLPASRSVLTSYGWLIAPVMAVVLTVTTFSNIPLMEKFFTYGYYYVLTSIFALWIWISLDSAKRNRLLDLLKADAGGLLFCIAMTAIVFVSVAPTLRVLFDQTNIIAVSKSLTFDRTVNNTLEGYWIHENFYPSLQTVEPRPFMMSFWIHLCHAVSGYRVENAYAVNALMLFGILSLAFMTVKRWLGSSWGYAVVLLISAQPVITQTATSAGLEMMNAFFFFMMLLSAAWAARAPSAERLLLLWAQLLMFAYTRYEAVVPAFTTVALLVLFRRIKLADLKGNLLLYSMTPLLLLPYFWQARITWKSHFDAMITSKPLDVPAFSAAYLFEHNLLFFKKIFLLNSSLPYAGLVNILGAAGLIIFFYRFLAGKTRIRRHEGALVWISGIAVIELWVIFTGYYYGNCDQPAEARFFTIFMILFSCAAVYGMSRLKFFRLPFVAILFSASCFMIYHPVSIESRFSNNFEGAREHRAIVRFLSRQPDKDYLVIYYWPGAFTVYNMNSISFQTANLQPSKIKAMLFEKRRFREIFVFQRFYRGSEEPAKWFKLVPDYDLETVAELPALNQGLIRVSRVVQKTRPA